MQINLRATRENSRWSQVVPRPLPRVRDPDIIVDDYESSPFINKGDRLGVPNCKVKKQIVDCDYVDCGLKRGTLGKFISSPYINLSNPWLRKVNYKRS